MPVKQGPWKSDLDSTSAPRRLAVHTATSDATIGGTQVVQRQMQESLTSAKY